MSDFFCPLRDYNKCKCNFEKNCVSYRQVVEFDDFIYITIAKSASTSIINSLNRPYTWMPLNELIDSKKFKFSIVRNPYTRLVSAWNGWIYKRRNSPLHNDKIYYKMNFNDFIKAIKKMELHEYNEHYQLQTEYLFKNGKPYFDFVGNLETLEKDWSELNKKINKNFEIKHLANANISNHMSLYNKESLKIVNEIYDKDFTLLGYAKTL